MFRKSPKMAVAVLVLAGLLLFVLQNDSQVFVSFLFWDWGMPQAVLIFVVLALGFGTGWFLREWKAHRDQAAPEDEV